MCGIAGILDRDRRDPASRIPAMLDCQRHRGPDGDGIWTDAEAPSDDGSVVDPDRAMVALGHLRLSILDLTDAGAQPMHWGGRYTITYNGEVYDYLELRAELEDVHGLRFHTQCDTEVLLAAYATWGADCLHRLNGMFAFAIWDRVEQTLFLARDRMGVKPLAYTWDGQRLGFASEAKALLAAGLAPGTPDPDAIYEYLARGITTAGRSFHEGVHILPPGHAMRLGAEGPIETWEWWTPSREDDPSRSYDDWAEEVASVLDDAVRLRLRSDVPVGAHLSGGMDSSAVVAAAARHGGAEVQTFTGAFLGDARSDEREFSRAVNEMYGLTAHEVEIDIDGLADQFGRILWHMDEPIAGPGVYPQLRVCDLVREAGVTVVLGGQGGDELFGGYLRHRAMHWRQAMRSGNNPIARASAFLELARLAAGEWKRVRRTATGIGDGDLSPRFLALVDPDLREESRRGRMGHATASDAMWWDLRNYLPALLHVEDRTSMAASLESRTPLLDWRLVELALTIPQSQLFRPGRPKPLLRSAVQSWLPPSVADRRDKRGFPTPLHQWRERPALTELVERYVDPAWKPRGGAAFEPVFGGEFLAGRNGLQPSQLWTVLCVQGWLDQTARGARIEPIGERAAA